MAEVSGCDVAGGAGCVYDFFTLMALVQKEVFLEFRAVGLFFYETYGQVFTNSSELQPDSSFQYK